MRTLSSSLFFPDPARCPSVVFRLFAKFDFSIGQGDSVAPIVGNCDGMHVRRHPRVYVSSGRGCASSSLVVETVGRTPQELLSPSQGALGPKFVFEEKDVLHHFCFSKQKLKHKPRGLYAAADFSIRLVVVDSCFYKNKYAM